MEKFFTDVGLPMGYVLLVLGVIVALGFASLSVVSDIKAAKTSVIGVVGLLVIFLIGYAMADDSVVGYEKYGVTPGNSKFIGALIHTGFILFIIGIITGIVGQVYTMIKR